MIAVRLTFIAALSFPLITVAQETAPQSVPVGPICLTNACGGGAVDFTGQTPARTVAEAIALGNAQAVKDLGGTAAQAAQALLRRVVARAEQENDPTRRANRADSVALFTAFADVSGGGTLSYEVGAPGVADVNGRAFTGVIVHRRPEGAMAMLTSDGGAELVAGALSRP